MEYLYAPWRGLYNQNAQEHKHLNKGCPFCNAAGSKEDITEYVLKRTLHCTILLNLYPYNPGHLLIIPNAHKANLYDLSPEERATLIECISLATTVLNKTLKSCGINVGINLGDSASGGSIPEHLHVHIVPRWPGDTNFMPVVAGTKQLSEDLNEIYKKLKKTFDSIEE